MTGSSLCMRFVTAAASSTAWQAQAAESRRRSRALCCNQAVEEDVCGAVPGTQEVAAAVAAALRCDEFVQHLQARHIESTMVSRWSGYVIDTRGCQASVGKYAGQSLH